MSHGPTEQPTDMLRVALQRYLRHQLPDTELKRTLRSWVWQIKASGLRAEDVILSFNDLWRSLPDVQRASPMKQKRLREQLVSECIADYYEDVD